MGTLHGIARLMGAESEIGMLAAQGPGFKMPPSPAPKPATARPRAWAGQAQTVVGLLLILIGISGLAYPLLATVVADLGSPPAEVPQAQDSGLMDPKYFWADSTSSSPPKHSHARSRRPVVISAAAAYAQAPRVSFTRGLPLPDIRALIAARARGRGHLSVAELNLALDRLAAKKKILTAHLGSP